ncbi:hypothetical protein C1H70_07685 [Halomonas urumqiensis]|uniref:Uncharacterized protein n=1 Tax=Halomonas urumqiensis TaxID=1684789 RepID=A0A2N7UKG3_9GAMM|nr:hypothetical protein C1H70_07685 [Halomonas urumqiensis]
MTVNLMPALITMTARMDKAFLIRHGPPRPEVIGLMAPRHLVKGVPGPPAASIPRLPKTICRHASGPPVLPRSDPDWRLLV